jgi:A118 family predicted phage portal protein
MDVYATLYNLAPAGDYSATYAWDDSIVNDSDTQFKNDQATVAAGGMPMWVFLMRNYGLDEEKAKEWIAEIQAQKDAALNKRINSVRVPVPVDMSKEQMPNNKMMDTYNA